MSHDPLDPRVDSHIVCYADAGYLSDPHRARSQTGYVFNVGDTAISWKSTKQMLVATSLNHVEILALHEASSECFWLRAVLEHIRSIVVLLLSLTFLRRSLKTMQHVSSS